MLCKTLTFKEGSADNHDLVLGTCPVSTPHFKSPKHTSSPAIHYNPEYLNIKNGNPNYSAEEEKLEISLSHVVEKGEISERALVHQNIEQPRKLTPRERWQKAIRKVIFLGKFGLLNNDLKKEANLFGKSTIINKRKQKEADGGTKCRVIYIYIYI